MYIIKKKIISYKGKVLYEKMEQIGQDRTGRGSVIKFNSGQHGKVWKKKKVRFEKKDLMKVKVSAQQISGEGYSG